MVDDPELDVDARRLWSAGAATAVVDVALVLIIAALTSGAASRSLRRPSA